MLTDLSAQILSLLALVFAARPATARRTFGYYRLEILAALANGTALLVLAGYIIWTATKRLVGTPAEIQTDVMLVVGVIGLVANLIAAFVLHGARSLNVRGAYLHIVTDALSSLAVVIGGVVMHLRGAYAIDAVLGFLIATMVLVSAYRLVREASDVLLEAVPKHIDPEQVRRDVRELSGIEDVHDLHIWTITSGMFALSAHIVVKKDTLITANDELLRSVKELLHRRHRISHSTLQIESTEYEHVAHIH
jgi:cobalt-zinc-cadmium efflux system protein